MGIYFQKNQKGTFGTLVIDRKIGGRRLKVSTGSKDRKTARRMNDLIDDLIDRGYSHHLTDLLDRRVTIRKLYELEVTGKLNAVPIDTEILQALRPQLEAWMETYTGWQEKTRRTNEEFISTLFRRMADSYPAPTVSDTPKLLRGYRDYCEVNAIPRVFNLVRSILHRFVRTRFGKSSVIFTQLSDVEKLPDSPKNALQAKTPGQIERLSQKLPEKYQRMVWTMCTTGVGWAEYQTIEVREELKNPRIYVGGTKLDKKDARRRREVPLVYPAYPSEGSERHFRKVLKKAAQQLGIGKVGIYTFRKCYANWLQEAGVPQWRVEMYMGHQPATMTQKYQKTDVFLWLRDDAERLRAWLEEARMRTGSK